MVKNIYYSDLRIVEGLLLLLLLGVAILIRVNQLDFPLFNPDFSRDSLIGRHIAQFGETTNFGPVNPLLGQLKNSPLYYYLLAGVIKISDNFYFLQFFNLILQLVPIICFYIIGKILYGRKVGALTAFFFSVNPVIVPAAGYFWQPYLMNVFLGLGLLAGVFFLNRRNFPGIIFSSLLLTLAGLIQNSAWGLVPAFWVLGYFLLQKNLFRALAMVASNLALAALFFIPNVASDHILNPISPIQNLNLNPTDLVASLWSNWIFFISSFFQTPPSALLSIMGFLSIVVFGYYLRSDRKVLVIIWTIALCLFYLQSGNFLGERITLFG